MLLRLGHDVREVVAHDLEVRGLAEDAVMLSSTVKLEALLSSRLVSCTMEETDTCTTSSGFKR